MSKDLDDAAGELAGYLPMLEDLLPQQPDGGQPSVTMTGATASSPPWNPGPAYVLMTIHEGTRRLEDELRGNAGLTVRHRGGSDANTVAAIDAIADLGATLDSTAAAEVTSQLMRWADQARRLDGIDELPRWRPIRHTDGSLPPACPYCETFSLRVAAASGAVLCFMPACRDSDGKRPYGRLDYSKIDGAPIVAWGDGLVERAMPGPLPQQQPDIVAPRPARLIHPVAETLQRDGEKADLRPCG